MPGPVGEAPLVAAVLGPEVLRQRLDDLDCGVDASSRRRRVHINLKASVSRVELRLAASRRAGFSTRRSLTRCHSVSQDSLLQGCQKRPPRATRRAFFASLRYR